VFSSNQVQDNRASAENTPEQPMKNSAGVAAHALSLSILVLLLRYVQLSTPLSPVVVERGWWSNLRAMCATITTATWFEYLNMTIVVGACMYARAANWQSSDDCQSH
jgi:hypothetical protein